MKRQRFMSSRSLSRIFQEVADSWKSQDYQHSLDILARAARLDPANVGIHLDLGRAYGLRYDYSKAEQCFEKAIRIAVPKAGALTEAGHRCEEFGNYDLARRYFERAAQEDGVKADAIIALAELHERHAQLPQAIELAERALHLDPAHPAAGLARARLDRLSGQLADAETRLRGLINRRDGDPWARARAWYELGNCLDRMARYDEAMEAFTAAKTLLRPAAENHAATLRGIQARVREMEETITAPAFERWTAAAGDLQPLRRFAILCGHPRAGTTLLEQVLDAHPAVVSLEETHLLHDEAYLPLSRGFGPDASVLEVLNSAPVTLLRQSRENYFRYAEAFLGQQLGDKLLIDKNPALNVLIPAAARIFPEAKFLIALRDPRDVCLSCFMQPLAPNPVSSAYLTLEGTVKQYLSVMGFWCALRTRLRNPFLEVRYEDLVGNLEVVARRTLDFLELGWDERVLSFQQRVRSKLVRSPSYAEVSQPVTKRPIGRWQNYRRHLESQLEMLNPIIKSLGYA